MRRSSLVDFGGTPGKVHRVEETFHEATVVRVAVVESICHFFRAGSGRREARRVDNNDCVCASWALEGASDFAAGRNSRKVHNAWSSIYYW